MPRLTIADHTAVIDRDNAVTVMIGAGAGRRPDFPAVPLGPEDLQGHATRFLAIEGWHLDGPWTDVDGTLCAPAHRGPREGDPGMREAIVLAVARYILRGEAHLTRPAHSEPQILAYVRRQLQSAAAEGYTFPAAADAPEQVAAAGRELAGRVQDTNPDWPGWAFGH